MNKADIVTRAIMEKHGSGINLFTADEILIVAGITKEDEIKILSQLKNAIQTDLNKTK